MQEGKGNYPPTEDWQSRREVVREIPYSEFWTVELAQKWAGNIPDFAELESKETPLIEIELADEGFGKIWVKNEGDRTVNPTGTVKDRMARAYAATLGEIARYHLEQLAQDSYYKIKLHTRRLPRYSLITSGNAGNALANTFSIYELPPPKLLLDKHTPAPVLKKLKKLRTDLYLTDLSSNAFTGQPSQENPLEPDEILKLTNNEGGLDLTSASQIDDLDRPWWVYSYKLGKEIFSAQPNEIYVPFGTGMAFDGLVDHQYLLAREGVANGVKIFGAEPESFPSIADKLAAPVKPYRHFDEPALAYFRQKNWTHADTGVYKVSEAEIKEAYELLKRRGQPLGIEAEPSAAAGLALYIKRWRLGLIEKNAKVIVINTGRGTVSEEAA